MNSDLDSVLDFRKSSTKSKMKVPRQILISFYPYYFFSQKVCKLPRRWLSLLDYWCASQGHPRDLFQHSWPWRIRAFCHRMRPITGHGEVRIRNGNGQWSVNCMHSIKWYFVLVLIAWCKLLSKGIWKAQVHRDICLYQAWYHPSASLLFFNENTKFTHHKCSSRKELKLMDDKYVCYWAMSCIHSAVVLACILAYYICNIVNHSRLPVSICKGTFHLMRYSTIVEL